MSVGTFCTAEKPLAIEKLVDIRVSLAKTIFSRTARTAFEATSENYIMY